MILIVASGVSRISFRGGGVQIFSGKVGVFAWSEAIWCVLESILLKFCQKIIEKLVIFYIKITDNVLLRTIFRGIAAYTPQISCHLCDLVCFGVQFP